MKYDPSIVHCIVAACRRVSVAIQIMQSTSQMLMDTGLQYSLDLLRHKIAEIDDVPDVESIEILSPFIDCIDGTKPAVVIIAALESMESLFSSRVFDNLIKPKEGLDLLVRCLGELDILAEHNDVLRTEAVSVKLADLIHVLVTHEFTIISDDISSSLVKMLFEMAFRIKHSGMCITVVHSQIDGSFLLYQRLLHDVLYTLFHRLHGGGILSPVPSNDVLGSPLKTESSYSPKFADEQTVERHTSTADLYGYLLRCICVLINADAPAFVLEAGLSLLVTCFNAGQYGISSSSGVIDAVYSTLAPILVKLFFSNNLIIVSQAVHILVLLITFGASFVKPVVEMTLSGMLLRLSSARGISYEHEQLLLDGLIELCNIPSFGVGLFINYDCDLLCSDLFTELCRFLSKQAFPVNDGITTKHALALKGLIALLRPLATRTSSSSYAGFVVKRPPLIPSSSALASACQVLIPAELRATPSSDESSSLPSPQLISAVREIKSRFAEAADRFNKEPNSAWVYLSSVGMCSNPPDPAWAAAFIRVCPSLSKTTIGQYIGGCDEYNGRVLNHFVFTFDLEGTPILSALRMFLRSFRIPGEAQIIARVMEAFSMLYFNINGTKYGFANKDAVYLLSYAILMLNTDLHSTHVKRKMGLNDFLRNMRGANAGGDLERSMMEGIYESINTEEIALAEEDLFRSYLDDRSVSGTVTPSTSGDVSAGERALWLHLDDVFHRSLLSSRHINIGSSSQYDEMIIEVLWGPLVAALSVLSEQGSMNIYRDAIIGLRDTARVCGTHNMVSVVDRIVIVLAHVCGISQSQSNILEALTSFNKSPKGQLALDCLVNIVTTQGIHMRDSWKTVVDCVIEATVMLVFSACVSDNTISYCCGTSNDERSYTWMKMCGYVELTSPDADIVVPERLSTLLDLHVGDIIRCTRVITPEILTSVCRHMFKSCVPDVVKSWMSEQGSLTYDDDSMTTLASDMIKSCSLDVKYVEKADDGYPIPTEYSITMAASALRVLYGVCQSNRDRLSLIWPLCVFAQRYLTWIHTVHRVISVVSETPISIPIDIVRVLPALPGVRSLASTVPPVLYRTVLPMSLLSTRCAYRMILRVGGGDESLVGVMICSLYKALLDAPVEIRRDLAEEIAFGNLEVIKNVPLNVLVKTVPLDKSSVPLSPSLLTVMENNQNPVVCIFTLMTVLWNDVVVIHPTSSNNSDDDVRDRVAVSLLQSARIMLTRDMPVLMESDISFNWMNRLLLALMVDTTRPPIITSSLPTPIRAIRNAISKPTKPTIQNVPSTFSNILKTSIECFMMLVVALPSSSEPVLISRLKTIVHCLYRSALDPRLSGTKGARAAGWAAVSKVMLTVNISPDSWIDIGTDQEDCGLYSLNVLTKIMLHILPTISNNPGFQSLWLKMIGMFDHGLRHAVSMRSEVWTDSVVENLKNVLLVSYTLGVFKKPETAPAPDGGPTPGPSLWDITWAAIDTYLPSLHKELFPAPSPDKLL